MNVEQINSKIRKVIKDKSCQFKKESNLITVTEVTGIFITSKEINIDNPALDNYEFEGIARLSIPDENGIRTDNKRIKGTAKIENIKPFIVQIKTPISVY